MVTLLFILLGSMVVSGVVIAGHGVVYNDMKIARSGVLITFASLVLLIIFMITGGVSSL